MSTVRRSFRQLIFSKNTLDKLNNDIISEQEVLSVGAGLTKWFLRKNVNGEIYICYLNDEGIFCVHSPLDEYDLTSSNELIIING